MVKPPGPCQEFHKLFASVFEKFERGKDNYKGEDLGSTAACVPLESCPGFQEKIDWVDTLERSNESKLGVEGLRSQVCNRKLKKVCCQQIRFN